MSVSHGGPHESSWVQRCTQDYLWGGGFQPVEVDFEDVGVDQKVLRGMFIACKKIGKRS